MQAHIFVLDHDIAGLELVGDVKVLREILGRRLQPRTQIGFLAVLREGDAIHRADVDAGVAFDAKIAREDRLHVAIQAALRFLEAECTVETEFDFGTNVFQRNRLIA